LESFFRFRKGKHVIPFTRLVGRSVDEGDSFFSMQKRQLAEVGDIFRRKLLLAPEDGGMGGRGKGIDVRQSYSPAVMVPRHYPFGQFPEKRQAFVGVCPIAHHVAQKGDLFCPLISQILDDRPESFKISVNIGEDGPLHLFFELAGAPDRPEAARERIIYIRFLPGFFLIY